MATHTERIDKLDELVNYLTTQEKILTLRIEHSQTGLTATRDEMQKLRDEVQKLRDEVQKLNTAVGVLRAEVDELKKARDTWGLRLWQLAVGVLLAVLGGVIGYLIKR